MDIICRFWSKSLIRDFGHLVRMEANSWLFKKPVSEKSEKFWGHRQKSTTFSRPQTGLRQAVWATPLNRQLEKIGDASLRFRQLNCLVNLDKITSFAGDVCETFSSTFKSDLATFDSEFNDLIMPFWGWYLLGRTCSYARRTAIKCDFRRALACSRLSQKRTVKCSRLWCRIASDRREVIGCTNVHLKCHFRGRYSSTCMFYYRR